MKTTFDNTNYGRKILNAKAFTDDGRGSDIALGEKRG